jgi:hypothetical protein
MFDDRVAVDQRPVGAAEIEERISEYGDTAACSPLTADSAGRHRCRCGGRVMRS